MVDSGRCADTTSYTTSNNCYVGIAVGSNRFVQKAKWAGFGEVPSSTTPRLGEICMFWMLHMTHIWVAHPYEASFRGAVSRRRGGGCLCSFFFRGVARPHNAAARDDNVQATTLSMDRRGGVVSTQ